VAAALAQAGMVVPRRQASRVFQGVEDPDVVLVVAEWDSREAFAEHGVAAEARLDALGQAPPERWYFSVRRGYGLMQRRAAAVICALIRLPPGAGEAARELWSEGGEVLRQSEGFVQGYACQDEDDPDHFLILSEWESAQAARDFLNGPNFLLRPSLQALDAEVEAFVGVPGEPA
jgi:heme-degrading monooxygenase HmoA